MNSAWRQRGNEKRDDGNAVILDKANGLTTECTRKPANAARFPGHLELLPNDSHKSVRVMSALSCCISCVHRRQVKIVREF